MLDSQASLKPSTESFINGVTNWKNFQATIDSNINLKIRLKCLDDIRVAIKIFTRVIQMAVWNSSLPNTVNCEKYNFLIPLHEREIITKKRRARALRQRTRFSSDK